MNKYIDLTGMKFNKLTVIRLYERTAKRRYMWLCRCDCGKEKVILGDHLKNGHTKSCGCYAREKIKNLNKKTGLTQTKLFYTYHNMHTRCERKQSSMYALYGGRGINVCEEWSGRNGFKNFAKWSIQNGYKEGLQIDRIDNDKGYFPDNCRWVSIIEQANNKRNTVFISVNGEIDTVANLARKHNVSYWNLLKYAKGGKNCKYPNLKIEVVDGKQ